MKILIIIIGVFIMLFAFYQMIFGGSDKPQDSVPPTRTGGGNGGMPS